MSGPAIKTSPSLGDCTAQCPVGILAVAEHIFPAELLDLPSGLFSHPRAPAPVVGGIARRVPFLAVILGGEANLLQAHVEMEDLPAVLDVRDLEARLGQSAVVPEQAQARFAGRRGQSVGEWRKETEIGRAHV